MYAVSNAYKAAIAAADIMSDIECDIDGTTYGSQYIAAGSFSVTNQCTDTQDISLGSVYVGQLSATFIIPETSIARTSWQGRIITPTYKLWTGSDWESLPLGVFKVAESTWTAQGTKIIAYDCMTEFDKKCTATSGGYPYDLLAAACTACNVTMATTRAQIEAMPNGQLSFGYYADGDVKTWRDFIHYLAQILCAFATINRSGELEIRQFGATSVDSIGTNRREQSASFSDYETKYTAVTYMEIETQEEHTYTAQIDDGTEINLGSNPFLQTGSVAAACEALVTAVGALTYTPYTAAVAGNPAYDLGDCLTYTGGRAGTTATACLMKYTFSNHRKFAMNGYGANPAIGRTAASAKQTASNTRASINSLTKRIGDAGRYGVVFLAPTIPELKDIPYYMQEPIADGEDGNLAHFKFKVNVEKAPVAVHAVFELDAETTVNGDIYRDCEATITVNSDAGQMATWTEAFGDGLHIFNVDTIKKYFDTGEHIIDVNLALAGGYAALNKLRLRTAYLETRARVQIKERQSLKIYNGYVGDLLLSNCQVSNLLEYVDCSIESSGINIYSQYFLTGVVLWYRTSGTSGGRLWRINHNTASEKWIVMGGLSPVEDYEIEQVSGATVYGTVFVNKSSDANALLIASKDAEGNTNYNRISTGVTISTGNTSMPASGINGDGYYYQSPYGATGQVDIIPYLINLNKYYDYREGNPPIEPYLDRWYALQDFFGLDENKKDAYDGYPNRVLLKYLSSGGANSYMYIPITRTEVAWQTLFAVCKLYESVEGSETNAVGIGAGAVVNGQMVEIFATTDSESWTLLSLDVSSLPYIDYIILYGGDGAQGIRNIWLYREKDYGEEEEY